MDIDQKIILLDHQNNFVGILKIMNNATKKVNILATSYITSYQKVILLQIKYIFKLNLNRMNKILMLQKFIHFFLLNLLSYVNLLQQITYMSINLTLKSS